MKIIDFIINRVHRYSFICYSYSMRFCQNLKQKINNNKIFKILLFILSPLLVLKWILSLILEYTIGTLRAGFNRKKEKTKNYEDELSIVAIAKNEAPYIAEWIEFHKLVGVTKFYIYDNESDDNLKEVLQPYVDNGDVVYTFYPGSSKQLPAYNDAINKYKEKSRYMAFIDLDEFLAPGKYGESLPKVIEKIFSEHLHIGGIGVTWRIFGSSGREKKPDGLIIENYLNRGVDRCWQNYHIKTVCNPRLIKEYTSPHFPTYSLGFWNINENGKRLNAWFPLGQCYNRLKINHYFCKSKEEAVLKWNRGLADRNIKYDWKKFEDYDLNDIYDDDMLKYVDSIKKAVNKS